MPSVDFYVGTEPNAAWIATLDSPDGEPPCLLENTEFGGQVLAATDVVTYRDAVSALINEIREGGAGWCHTRSDGWPWSDPSSHRTDWVIQFHHCRAWITVGYPISPTDNADPPRPVSTTGHATTTARPTSHDDNPAHDRQADNRALSFALLRDAVDAVTEGDYPGSGLEEVIDDLRNAFDGYRPQIEDSLPDNAARATD